jgi:hypothetical protein
MRALAAEQRLAFVGEMNHSGLESRRALHGLRDWLSHRTHGAVDVDDLIDFYASPEHREEVYRRADHREASKVSTDQLLELLRIGADLSTGRPDVNLAPGIEVGFRTSEGKLARSKGPLEKAVLKHLCLNRGKVTPLKDLVEAAWRDAEEAVGAPIEPRDRTLDELVGGLIGLVDQGVLELRLRDGAPAARGGTVPAITRWQAERGHVLSTAHHALVAVDDLTRAVVLQLARGRARGALPTFVEGLVEWGRLVFSDEVAKKSAEEQRKFVAKAVDEAVTKLAQLGLLSDATDQDRTPAIAE